ncbi:hypothetical protein LX32DRAFT_237772 [Colletotrichum zoysiae]|uniref:Uncharacterized protein n=1 Tax=Colletotrichum zoysiae TaxID=1216348 RepID=A0AAD9HMU6_9PEZI|nr:hypothetical protein LX32DRAFT_237772 [Colletotrichum zoysiae]
MQEIKDFYLFLSIQRGALSIRSVLMMNSHILPVHIQAHHPCCQDSSSSGISTPGIKEPGEQDGTTRIRTRAICPTVARDHDTLPWPAGKSDESNRSLAGPGWDGDSAPSPCISPAGLFGRRGHYVRWPTGSLPFTSSPTHRREFCLSTLKMLLVLCTCLVWESTATCCRQR